MKIIVFFFVCVKQGSNPCVIFIRMSWSDLISRWRLASWTRSLGRPPSRRWCTWAASAGCCSSPLKRPCWNRSSNLRWTEWDWLDCPCGSRLTPAGAFEPLPPASPCLRWDSWDHLRMRQWRRWCTQTWVWSPCRFPTSCRWKKKTLSWWNYFWRGDRPACQLG